MLTRSLRRGWATRGLALMFIALSLSLVAAQCNSSSAKKTADTKATAPTSAAPPDAKPAEPTEKAAPAPTPADTVPPTAAPPTATPVPPTVIAVPPTATTEPTLVPPAELDITCSEGIPEGAFLYFYRCDVVNPGPATSLDYTVQITDGNPLLHQSTGTIDIDEGATGTFGGWLINAPSAGLEINFATGEYAPPATFPDNLPIPPMMSPPPDGWPLPLNPVDPMGDTFFTSADQSMTLGDPRADLVSTGAYVVRGGGLYVPGDWMIGPDGPFTCGEPNGFMYMVACNDDTGSDLSGAGEFVVAWGCTAGAVPVSGEEPWTTWLLTDNRNPADHFVANQGFPNDPLGGTSQQQWLTWDPYGGRWYTDQTGGDFQAGIPSNGRGFVVGNCSGFVIPADELDMTGASGAGFATFLSPADDPYGPSSTLDRSPDPNIELPLTGRCEIFSDGFASGDVSAWSAACPD